MSEDLEKAYEQIRGGEDTRQFPMHVNAALMDKDEALAQAEGIAEGNMKRLFADFSYDSIKVTGYDPVTSFDPASDKGTIWHRVTVTVSGIKEITK